MARWQLLSIYGSSNVIKAATYLQSTIFGGISRGCPHALSAGVLWEQILSEWKWKRFAHLPKWECHIICQTFY